MRFKWRYTLVPACISFGPFLAANMGGLGTGWAAPMLGSVMLTLGLSIMLEIVANQQNALDRLLEQNGPESSND